MADSDHISAPKRCHNGWRKLELTPEMAEEARKRADEAYFMANPPTTVGELVERYMIYVDGRYARSRRLTIRAAMERLLHVARKLPLEQMDVPTLHAAREVSVLSGMCRTMCNTQASIMRSMFKWAEARALVKDGLSEQLRTLPALKPGQTTAHETARVRPVDTMLLKATFKRLMRKHQNPYDAWKKSASLHLYCMLGVQLRTGMRPGEICAMRWSDIDRSGKVWIFEPDHHKTRHHGKRRRIMIGPKAQKLIHRWTQYRSTNQNIIFGLDQASYRRKLRRWTDACLLDRWSPNQLRHYFATIFSRRFDKEMTRMMLGHATAEMTSHYVVDDDQSLLRAVARAG